MEKRFNPMNSMWPNMAITLVNEKGRSFNLSTVKWKKIRECAELNGWIPLGTDNPGIDGWRGSYNLSEYQQFKTKDLDQLVAALKESNLYRGLTSFLAGSEKVWIC